MKGGRLEDRAYTDLIEEVRGHEMNGHPLEHLPTERRGLLGPLTAGNYGKLRTRILHQLRGG
jgi:hypothetical protein